MDARPVDARLDQRHPHRRRTPLGQLLVVGFIADAVGEALDRERPLGVLAQELREARHESLSTGPQRRAAAVEQDVVQRDDQAAIGLGRGELAQLTLEHRAALACGNRLLLRRRRVLLRGCA